MKTRILVIDDLESHLYLAKCLLEPYGYDVSVASSCADALKQLDEQHFDLILSDVSMPNASGFDLIQKVKANPKAKDVPFVFISAAHWSETDKQKGLALGAQKFIFRPLEARAILTEIEEVLPEGKRMSVSAKE